MVVREPGGWRWGSFKALDHLDFGNDNIGNEEAGLLAKMVGGCKALAYLYLGCNGIGAEGVGRVAEGLGECKGLAHLGSRRRWLISTWAAPALVMREWGGSGEVQGADSSQLGLERGWC